jgi:hypothetical protein
MSVGVTLLHTNVATRCALESGSARGIISSREQGRPSPYYRYRIATDCQLPRESIVLGPAQLAQDTTYLPSRSYLDLKKAPASAYLGETSCVPWS